MRVPVKFKIVSPLLKPEQLPAYKTEGAAGMDVCACLAEDMVLAPGARAMVPTGFAVKLPNADVAALLFARSGLAAKSGIALSNGVGLIDSDYTGEVKVAVTNFSAEPFTIHPFDRIAQLVIAPVALCVPELCEELPETDRGSGGFGSTGV